MVQGWLLVAVGGGIGSVLRYALNQQTAELSSALQFPIHTVGINILGCFAIGVVAAFTQNSSISTQTRLLLATGLLGGFTTFSAFGYETVELLQRGETIPALVNLFGQPILGALAAFAGIWAGGFLAIYLR